MQTLTLTSIGKLTGLSTFLRAYMSMSRAFCGTGKPSFTEEGVGREEVGSLKPGGVAGETSPFIGVKRASKTNGPERG